MLDGLTDEAMTTGDKNNVGHVVRVMCWEEGEEEMKERRKQERRGRGFCSCQVRIYGVIPRHPQVGILYEACLKRSNPG